MYVFHGRDAGVVELLYTPLDDARPGFEAACAVAVEATTNTENNDDHILLAISTKGASIGNASDAP